MIKKTTSELVRSAQVVEFADITIKSFTDVTTFGLQALFPTYYILGMNLNMLSLGRTKDFMQFDLDKLQLTIPLRNLKTALNGDYTISLVMSNNLATYTF